VRIGTFSLNDVSSFAGKDVHFNRADVSGDELERLIRHYSLACPRFPHYPRCGVRQGSFVRVLDRNSIRQTYFMYTGGNAALTNHKIAGAKDAQVGTFLGSLYRKKAQ
jgi:hypothetical protein